MKASEKERQQATKYVSKNYKDEDRTKKLTKAIDPKIEKADLDLDSNPDRFAEDLEKLENTVMESNAAMADYSFKKVVKITKDKYPKADQMPKDVVDALDNMLLWKLTAMLRDTYKNRLPEDFVSICMDILPMDIRFLQELGIKVSVNIPLKSASYNTKLTAIADFLKEFDSVHSLAMKNLRENTLGNPKKDKQN